MVQSVINTIRQNSLKITFITLSIVAILCILLIPGSRAAPMAANLSEYSSVSDICELATLKSFYHNVVLYEVQPDGFNKFANDVLAWPFGNYTRFGYKQYWLEYSGIVEAGIDASQIQIVGPDSAGVVKVYVPEAKVLSVYADEASLTDPISETGLFTTISGEEKILAFSATQTSMRQEAESDQVMLRRAKDNAKKLLERYIINTGRATGQELSVVWLASPQAL